MSLFENTGSSELTLLIRLCLLPEKVEAEEFKGIDEKLLFRLAQWHGVRNLVFAGLPEKFRHGWLYEQLQAFAMHSTFQSLNQTNHLVTLFETFEKSQIPVFAYKGIVWSKWLYNDLNSRSSGDIDLLIPKSYFNDAMKVVEQLGFKPDDYRQHLLTGSKAIKEAFFRTDYHVPLFNEQGIALELHWQPAYTRLCFDFPDNEWNEWKKPIEFQNHTITSFRNEYQLLLLILHHAGKERWDRLKYVADFVAYLNRHADTTDWDLVFRLAQKKGMMGLLQRAMGMVNTLVVDHPFAIPDRTQRTVSSYLDKWLKMEELPENSTLPYFLHALRERDGLSQRMKIVSSHISYFTEFTLLKEKMNWYKNEAGKTP